MLSLEYWWHSGSLQPRVQKNKRRGPLRVVAQHLVQLSSRYLQGWGPHNLVVHHLPTEVVMFSPVTSIHMASSSPQVRATRARGLRFAVPL